MIVTKNTVHCNNTTVNIGNTFSWYRKSKLSFLVAMFVSFSVLFSRFKQVYKKGKRKKNGRN